MKKILVSAGYMSSGSSAVTGYFKEFSNCYCPNNYYEYVFLHCPNGLFDLEDNLLLGNNAIKSDYYIRTFYKEMKKLYNKRFYWVGNYKDVLSYDFLKITTNYLKDIVQFKYTGFWYTHEEVNNKMFFKLLLEKPFKIISNNKIKFKKVLNTDQYMYISFIDKDDFYKKSHDYIYNVLNEIKTDKNLVLDQLLLPFNLHRIDKYFDDDLRVVVVERDPRDLFIINKYIAGIKKTNVPLPNDAKQFCDFYKKMRESEKKTNSNKILRIKFEDLIYDYENITNKINDFAGLKESEHIDKLKYFNYNVSINNTQVFRKKEFIDEVKIIEKELKDYLYDFPKILDNDVNNTIEEFEMENN